MAISALLPAGGANDNRPNLKQFFGKNPAVANDNAERVSGGLFSNIIVNSVVTTLQSLVEEIAKITDIAKSVIASLGAVVKSLKNLNKDITTRFRVLNNEMNASRIDFIRTVLAIPKTDVPVKIDGVPVNVNAPQEEPKKEDDKSNFFGDLFEKLILGWITKNLGPTALNMLKSLLGVAETLLRLAGSIALELVGKLPALFRMMGTLLATPVGGALAAGAVAAILLYKGLQELTKAIMDDPMFDALKKRSEGKTDQQEVSDNAKEVGSRLKGRPDLQKGFKGIKEAFYDEPGNSWGDGGAKLKQSDFKRFPKNKEGQEVGILKNKLKDGTVAINIQTGQRYGEIDENKSVAGDVVVSNPIGPPPSETPSTPSMSAPAGAPTQAAPAALGQTGAGAFGLGGATGTNAAPTGAPAGEVKQESNAPAPPPSGAPAGTATATSVAAPPAGPSGGPGTGSDGGVAVVQNSSVQNVGSTAGAETGGMTGQNLPMFARNPKLQESFGRQTVKYQ